MKEDKPMDWGPPHRSIANITFAHAIARFIRDSFKSKYNLTSSPLCISIQDPLQWSKTWLMQMIQHELDPDTEKRCFRLTPKERERLFFQLHIRRTGAYAIKQLLYNRISAYARQKTRLWKWGSLVGFVTVITISIFSNMGTFNLSPALGLGGIVAVTIPMIKTLLEYYKPEDLKPPLDQLFWKLSAVEKKMLTRSYVSM
jgi:hypothetical protein